MEWLNKVWEFLNKPLPIVGISVLMILFIVLKFISTTSVGQKAIKEFKRKYDDLTSEYNHLKLEYKQFKESVDSQIAELTENYETRLNIALAQFDYFESSIFSVLDKIPNAKVQSELKIFKEGYEEKKKEVGLLVNADIETKFKEIDALKQQLINEFNKVMENVYGKNNKTTEE